MKLARFCGCGASMVITGPEDRRKAIEEAAAMLWAGHDGSGHGVTDRAGARRAREKSEMEAIRAELRL